MVKVSSLRVAPPWRPAGNQRLIFMGILRWLFCHRTWCQGAIASLARHSAVGLVFWLEVLGCLRISTCRAECCSHWQYALFAGYQRMIYIALSVAGVLLLGFLVGFFLALVAVPILSDV